MFRLTPERACSINVFVPLPPTKAERTRRIEHLASQLVDAFEAHAEFKVARDHSGDKQYHASKRRLQTLLLNYGREIAEATVAAVMVRVERMVAERRR